MAVMVIVMVMFIVMGGHHDFGGWHQHDTNPLTAESVQPPMNYGEPAKPEQDKR